MFVKCAVLKVKGNYRVTEKVSGPVWVDLKLGSSFRWWAGSIVTYCPRPPAGWWNISNLGQPRTSENFWVTLYNVNNELLVKYDVGDLHRLGCCPPSVQT